VSNPEPTESRIGTVLDDRYRLDAVLGVGGFGTVYRARHLALDHDVAIKLLHADVGANAAKRLTREAKVLARLDHPNNVRYMDFGSHGGAPYLVMELVKGRSLAHALDKAWAPHRAVDTALELLAGLAHAHALGLVHRDLKPGNVLLIDDPHGGATVKIIDFGIVAIAAGEQLGSFTEQLTATGRIIGTPRYMSPEQLLGTKIDARSDLYAVGLILYEMLAGQPVFDAADSRQLAWLHVVAAPPLLPDGIPDELAALIDELLAKKSEQRPAGAAQVHERLLALRNSLDSKPSEPINSMFADTAQEPLTMSARPLASNSVGPEQRVGRYLLLRELGRGAMGVVYLGWDEALDRPAAIKLLHPTPAQSRANARMFREARGLARVTHPNVVSVYELGSHDGQLFVAMQYVRGRTLRDWQSERPRAWTETLARLIDAGRGLAAVHAAGLVHRDFKPDNVLVGVDERARVADFGLVRAVSPAFEMVDQLAPRQAIDPLEAKLTRTGSIIGTPAYMALEQLAGHRVDARCDQFAFCVVAYEALFSVRPFSGETLEVLAARLTAGHIEPRPSDSAVPRAIDQVLARGLQVMPVSRWPNMDALLDALEQAAGVRRSWPMRGLIAGLVGSGLIVAAAWAFGGRDEVELASGETVSAPIHDEQLERRNRELEQELDRTRARLARANPEDPESWRDAIELAARHRDAMPLEVRASLHAVAGAVHEGYPLRELGEVGMLAWSPAEPLLALARHEGGIAIWDADARTLVRTLEHGEPLDSPVFSHDGELLVARDRGGHAILWHVSTGTKLGLIEQPRLRIAKFVADTRQLAVVADAGVSLWALVRGRELERGRIVTDEGDVLALASDGDRLLSISEAGRASTWTLAAGPVARVELEGFGASSDQTVVLAPNAARGARASTVGLELWDLQTGSRIPVPTLEHAEVGALEFSPDSRTLAVAVRGRAPMLFDAATGEPRTTIATQIDTRTIGFDPSGTRLFVLADDGRLEIVDPATGHVLDRIAASALAGRAPTIAGAASRVAIVGDDNITWVWSSTSVAVAGELAADPAAAMPEPPSLDPGERIAGFRASGPITALAVSRDASRIATATGAWPSRVEVWTRDGSRVAEIRTAESEIHTLAFSPDATLLAVGGSEVHLWQLDAAFDLATLTRARSPVRSLAFEADGRKLAIVHEDGTRTSRWVDEANLFSAVCSALENSMGESARGCDDG
jgi:serine/threonine protein kinase/WD40 repeat protein